MGKIDANCPDLIKTTIIETPATYIRGRLKLSVHCIQANVTGREKSNTMLGSSNKNIKLKIQLCHYNSSNLAFFFFNIGANFKTAVEFERV